MSAAESHDEVNYPSYLHLERLLGLQQGRAEPEHPDELLFIVVHQASELWFKVLLRDIDGLVAAFEGGNAGLANWHVRRINTIMRIVSSQLSSLDALPPQHFAQFRQFLGTSSGSQSVQFRTLEAASGLRDSHFMQALREHGDIPEPIKQALARPTLQELFLALVRREGLTLQELYTGPGPGMLFFLAEGLLEYEQQFAEWRFKHVMLVERILGPDTGGTGGTLGAKYLSRTVSQRFFPELWAVRAKFYGA